MEKIAVLSFYSFIHISSPEILLPKLLYIGKRKYIRGTILLAHEGFNGSVSGNENNLKFLLDELTKFTVAKDVNIKVNYCETHPFSKLKVKLKLEIVALGIKDINVDQLKGEYIKSKDWDNFITKHDVILIDTRNDYEVKMGAFQGAISPNTDNFKQFPNWVRENYDLLKDKKIAMYCTGGIRCEKSTSYLKMQGLQEIYHLEGGILQYLEETNNKNGLWQGECFVFDDRIAVNQELGPIKSSSI